MQRVRCLAFYIISNVVVGLMVYAVPEKSHGHRHRVDALATMITFQVLSLVLLLTLQATDPGYITKAMAEATLEEAGLLTAGVEEGLPWVRRSPEGNRHEGRGAGEDKPGSRGGAADDGAVRPPPPRDEAKVPDSPTRQEDEEGGEDKGPAREQADETSPIRTGKKREERPGYCTRCDMPMPLRAAHCRECNRCVALLDHHCFCIGTCIGERNHARFWWFLLAQNAAVFSSIRVIDTGWVRAPDGTDWVLLNTLPICMSIFLWGMAVFVGLLLISHTFFAFASTTTYECGRGPERIWYLRGTRDCDMPFSKGCVENLRDFCFTRDGCWAWVMGKPWEPTVFRVPGPIIRDSDNICDHPWRNRYYSCC